MNYLEEVMQGLATCYYLEEAIATGYYLEEVFQGWQKVTGWLEKVLQGWQHVTTWKR